MDISLSLESLEKLERYRREARQGALARLLKWAAQRLTSREPFSQPRFR